MPIPIYIGHVIWPGREFDDKFNPGQKKVSATFLPQGREDKKAHHVRVNARSGSKKAKRLLAMRKGESYVLAYLDRKDKSYHDLVNFHGALVEMGNAQALAPASSPAKTTELDPDDFR